MGTMLRREEIVVTNDSCEMHSMGATNAQGVPSHVFALLKTANNDNYNRKAILTCLMLLYLNIIYQTNTTMKMFFLKN